MQASSRAARSSGSSTQPRMSIEVARAVAGLVRHFALALALAPGLALGGRLGLALEGRLAPGLAEGLAPAPDEGDSPRAWVRAPG